MAGRSEEGAYESVTCNMNAVKLCRAGPVRPVLKSDAGPNAAGEQWFAGLLNTVIGPRDRQDELRAPAVGVFLSYYHPAEATDAVGKSLQEQLELHHPRQCCAYCRRSWHHVLTVYPDTGVASKFFCGYSSIG